MIIVGWYRAIKKRPPMFENSFLTLDEKTTRMISIVGVGSK